MFLLKHALKLNDRLRILSQKGVTVLGQWTGIGLVGGTVGSAEYRVLSAE